MASEPFLHYSVRHYSQANCCFRRSNVATTMDSFGTETRRCRISQSLFKPFPNDKILDSTKLKEFADDNSEFDENGRKFSNPVENTVGKGEIARYV